MESKMNARGPAAFGGLSGQLTRGCPRVDLKDFAGGIPQEMASFPQIRIGRRWFTTAQILTLFVPVGFVGALVMVALAQYLRTVPGVEAFIAAYPGTGDFARPVGSGFPWWLRWQHFLNLFLMLFIMRSGLQILADHPRLYLNGDCTPGTDWFRLRGPVPTDRVWIASGPLSYVVEYRQQAPGECVSTTNAENAFADCGMHVICNRI